MGEEVATSLAELIRRYRLRAGLSQGELAERAALTASGVGQLERGVRRRPQPHTARALADALALGEVDRARLLAAARTPAPPGPDAGSAPTPNQDAPAPAGRPVIAASPTPPPPTGLPATLSSFVGRERELSAVAMPLARGVRLLTLTGPGGAGKTRLAVEAARAVAHNFPDGVWFVDLAPLAAPELVPQTVATVLDVPDAPGRSFTEGIVVALRDRTALLVLDNCEHLLDACAALVAVVLGDCPGVTLIATSRGLLRVPGEQVYAVPPLAVPPAETDEATALAEFAAVHLFVDRARAVRPGFGLTAANAAAVAEVCRRLDGLPLALELAAARVRVLPPEQIATRLDDRFRLLAGGARDTLPRHQTLRALIDWSYGLLAEPEQALLRRLAVFAGGWTLEAAEAICAGDGIEAWQVLDLLTALVDQSLVVVEQRDETTRYRMLESIREYATVQLVASGEAARVRLGHRDWYWALAEHVASGPAGRRQAQWMPRLAEEHDNLRAAIEWSLTDGQDPASGLAIVYALRTFWVFRHLVREGVSWYTRALAATGAAVPELRAKALGHMAIAAWLVQDPATGLPAARQALDLARQISHGWATVRALRALALHTYATGDPATAISLLAEALAQARLLEESHVLPQVLNSLGYMTLDQGDVAGARGLLLEALQTAQAEDSDEEKCYALVLLGFCALLQGEAAEAVARLAEGLDIAMAIEHSSLIANGLVGLALAAGLEGRFERAARLLGAWDAMCERYGIVKSPREVAVLERGRKRLRAAMGEPAFADGLAAGRAMPLHEALREALEGAAPHSICR